MARNKNASLALSLGAFVLGMVMLSYASVPLYRLFCQTTGFGGVARKTDQTPTMVSERVVTVRFDANINPLLNWEFKPLTKEVKVHIGERKTIEYEARNLGAGTSRGNAVFNVTPIKAGGYFDKIQCFCFTDQTLKAGETKQLGVTFFIDPEMLKNHDLDEVDTMTLSYTFFPAK